MTTLPGCVPFFIFISNELKHRERFAIRSKIHTSLNPSHNKYLSSFTNIRIIQKYLVSKAEQLLIPCIDNTNVDRSVAAIHSVLLRCMRHLSAGESLFDLTSHRAIYMHEELKHSQHEAWSSKRMQQVIKMKVEKRELFKRLFAQSNQGNSVHQQDGPHQSDEEANGMSPNDHSHNNGTPNGHAASSSSGLTFQVNRFPSISSAILSIPATPLPLSPILSPLSHTPTQSTDFLEHENMLWRTSRSASASRSNNATSYNYVHRASVSGNGGEDEPHFELYQEGTSPPIVRSKTTPIESSDHLASRPSHHLYNHSSQSFRLMSPSVHFPSSITNPHLNDCHSRPPIDSEDDTPMASENDTDTDADDDNDADSHSLAASAHSHSHSQSHNSHTPHRHPRHSYDPSSMSHRIDRAATHPHDTTPSLYSSHSFDDMDGDHDHDHDDDGGEEDEEEHINVDLSVLDEEDEEAESDREKANDRNKGYDDDGDEDEDEDGPPHTHEEEEE